jgi:hypothetical protein
MEPGIGSRLHTVCHWRNKQVQVVWFIKTGIEGQLLPPIVLIKTPVQPIGDEKQ